MRDLDQAKGNALKEALGLLARIGVVPQAVAALEKSARGASAELRKAIMADIPGFVASGNPDILPGLEQHIQDHIGKVMQLFGGGEIDDLEFVKAHARLRAGQRFPLEATLHAYRCGLKVLSHWLRDAAIAVKPKNVEAAVAAVADFAIEYTDVISIIAAAEYVAETRALAEAEIDMRSELLNLLLSGYDEADGRAARLLKRAGYLEQRQSYCIAAAQSVNPAEMEHPERAQRIVSAFTEVVVGTSIRVLAGVRKNLAVAVYSDRRRQSGWTAPQSSLAERVVPRLLVLGPAVLVGLSGDHPSTSFLPTALHEAAISLDFASVTRRVVQFSALPVRELLIHYGADHIRSAPPIWLATFMEADVDAGGALVQTLRALANADMNVQKAARSMKRHPNTLYARLEKIRALTGLDASRFFDLTELLLAGDCCQ